MIVLVDPVSTGKDLSAAFAARGETPLHLYTDPALTGAAQTDRHPAKLITDGVKDALRLLDGVPVRAVVAGSEWGVEPANQINNALGLDHHVFHLGAARRNKADMYKALEAAGVPVGFSRTITSHDATADVARAVPRWPVVVKPVDSAGGDACQVCHDEAEFKTAVADGLGRTNLLGSTVTAMVVQEFLEGPQYIVNTVSLGGRHLLSDVHTVRIDQIQNRPVLRHAQLITELNQRDHALVDYTMRCLDALGIREGAAHTEVRMTAAGPRLVEVNARIMGACMAKNLFGQALDATQADLIAERYLAPDAFTHRFADGYAPRASAAIVCLFVPAAGTVRKRSGLAWLQQLAGFHSFDRVPAVGDVIDEPWLCTGQAGMAYFLDRDPARLHRTLSHLHHREDEGHIYHVDSATEHDRRVRHDTVAALATSI